MKKQNVGKEFESCINECLNRTDLNISFDRLPDPLGGLSGVRNICDFTCYKYPFKYYLECKCTYDNTLNFKSDITADQWEGLTKKSKLYGCLAGFCVWFISYDVTIFVPIQEMQKLRDSGKKSLNINDVDNTKLKYFDIIGKKKRKYFDYDTEPFLCNLENFCKDYWNISEVN